MPAAWRPDVITDNLVFVCQDGAMPSGVATYGGAVLAAVPRSRMLLLNTGTPPPAFEREVHGRITCVSEGASHDPRVMARHLAAVVADSEGPTVIMPNTGDTVWAAAVDWLNELTPELLKRIRVVGTVHSDVETQYSLAERHVPIAPVWFGVSRRCSDELRRRVGPLGARVHELPCPIAVEAANRVVAEDLPLKLAYVGRLEEAQKRVSRLADLFAALGRLGVPFEATVAGEGAAFAGLRERVGRLKGRVADSIRMVGRIDPSVVKSLWQTHDICLLTSAYEGMPLALLEAMAAGVCPVVMAVASGLPELVSDGVNGRVVPQGDVDAMAGVIAELSVDRAQLARLGVAARDTVVSNYSPEAHFLQLEKIIDDAWTFPPPDPGRIQTDPIREAVAGLAERAGKAGSPAAVYGAGMFGRKVVDACFDRGLAVVALIDSDPGRKGFRYRGMTCAGPEVLAHTGAAAIVIGSIEFAGEIEQGIRSFFEKQRMRPPAIISVRP